MLAEIDECVACDEGSRRRRDEHLPAVPASRDPGGAVDVVANVSLVGDERRAGMHAHPQPDPVGSSPARPSPRRPRAPPAPSESDEERVALRVDLDAAVCCERFAPAYAMLGQSLRVALRAEVVQELCRAFDVREQERHRS